MKERLGHSSLQQILIPRLRLLVHLEGVGSRIKDPPLLLVGGDKQALDAPIIGLWDYLAAITGRSLGRGKVAVAGSGCLPCPARQMARRCPRLSHVAFPPSVYRDYQ